MNLVSNNIFFIKKSEWGALSLLVLVCLSKTFLEVSDLLLAITRVRQFDTKNFGLMWIYFVQSYREQYQIMAYQRGAAYYRGKSGVRINLV